MKRLTVWVALTPLNGTVNSAQKTSILIEENTMHLNREDKLYNIGKALYEQKKIPAINLIAYG